jgi:hypothetical protein
MDIEEVICPKATVGYGGPPQTQGGSKPDSGGIPPHSRQSNGSLT